LSSPTLGIDTPILTTFGDFGLPDALVEVLAGQGITAPLPIQAMTIADALAGRDVSAKAPTGSGKTLAFALPVAATVQHCAPKKPQALILVPTRELALQISDVLAPLLRARKRSVAVIYGGVSYERQRKAMRNGADVVVACPGRLEDLMQAGTIRLADVRTVVLDEADRMADMGFLPAVRRILDATAPNRQTLLFSATLDGDVDILVRKYQNDPVRHEVVNDADDLSRVTHAFHHVAHADRAAALTQLASASTSSIIFVRTKHSADRVATKLARSGIAAQAIHGGRSQAQRERTLSAFRAGRVHALVATDVAARGIHVDDVSTVIHYDLPESSKDYVHRSGRTARAGADGAVIALVTPEQRHIATNLLRTLGLDVTDANGTRISADPQDQGARPPKGNPRRGPKPAGAQRHRRRPQQAAGGRRSPRSR
jgi:superfamily II DNA/RNA helicase